MGGEAGEGRKEGVGDGVCSQGTCFTFRHAFREVKFKMVWIGVGGRH